MHFVAHATIEQLSCKAVVAGAYGTPFRSKRVETSVRYWQHIPTRSQVLAGDGKASATMPKLSLWLRFTIIALRCEPSQKSPFNYWSAQLHATELLGDPIAIRRGVTWQPSLLPWRFEVGNLDSCRKWVLYVLRFYVVTSPYNTILRC